MKLSFNPRVRIQQHVEYLRKHIEITNEIDQKNFDHVYESFQSVAQKLQVYQWVRNVVAVLLYVGIISTLATSILPFASWILSPVMAISSLVGISVLGAAWILLNAFINTVLFDLISEHSHLIAILVKNNDEFIAHPEFTFGLFKQYN